MDTSPLALAFRLKALFILLSSLFKSGEFSFQFCNIFCVCSVGFSGLGQRFLCRLDFLLHVRYSFFSFDEGGAFFVDICLSVANVLLNSGKIQTSHEQFLQLAFRFCLYLAKSLLILVWSFFFSFKISSTFSFRSSFLVFSCCFLLISIVAFSISFSQWYSLKR